MPSSTPLVLVADDEPSMLELVARHLKTMRDPKLEVIEASDGEQAWRLAREHLPDLVVLDVMMPGMSGWEVCRKIREDVSLAHTGVVMLTGIGENLNQMTSPLYGADAYIDKPFDFGELDEKVRTALRTRAAQRNAVERPRFNGVGPGGGASTGVGGGGRSGHDPSGGGAGGGSGATGAGGAGGGGGGASGGARGAKAKALGRGASRARAAAAAAAKRAAPKAAAKTKTKMKVKTAAKAAAPKKATAKKASSARPKAKASSAKAAKGAAARKTKPTASRGRRVARKPARKSR